MASVNKAIGMVVEYIVYCGLYNFKSLAEETQQKLVSAYGADFEHQVNARLTL